VTEAAVPSPQRDWWLRSLLVLQAPRAVFTALRDESDEEVSARAEPVLAIVILAGIAAVLQSNAAAHLLDDAVFDGLLIAVWAFLAGALYGAFVYWAGGLVLHVGLKALGSRGRFRRSRHLLAFSWAPLVLSLLLWVPRLALYGGDSFRYGGSDSGTGNTVFGLLELACAIWALALLLVGIHALERWSWARSLAGVAVAAALPVLLALAAYGWL